MPQEMNQITYLYTYFTLKTGLFFGHWGKNSRWKKLKTKTQTQAQNSIFRHILGNSCLNFVKDLTNI